MKKIVLAAFLLLSGVTLFSSCRGRDGGFNVFSEEDDVELGQQFDSEIKSNPEEFPVLSRELYPEAYYNLSRVVTTVLSSKHVLHRHDFPWKVTILINDTVRNAFCTPGGYIYVYTGLIRSLHSEDQLAGVLGHEIAHADLRHSTEQMTKSYGIRLLLQFIFGDHSMLGGLASNLAGLTFSRSDEEEADRQSVIYLSDTDYDARGVARFFQQLQKEGETMGAMEFLSTHPNPENRVQKIMDEWKELGSRPGKTYKERYGEMVEALP